MSRVNRKSSLLPAIILSIAVLSSLSKPASAEKVVYLLQETGQASALLSPDPITGQQFSFSYNGPFFPSFWHGFHVPSHDREWAGIEVDYNFRSVGDGEYDMDFYTSAQVGGLDPQHEEACFSLDWMLRVGDEPIDMWGAAAPSPGEISTSRIEIQDKMTGESFEPAGEDMEKFCTLQPGKLYEATIYLSASDFSYDTKQYTYIRLDGGQLIPVPEPSELFFLGLFLPFCGLNLPSQHLRGKDRFSTILENQHLSFNLRQYS
jgi:hypothetical protein